MYKYCFNLISLSLVRVNRISNLQQYLQPHLSPTITTDMVAQNIVVVGANIAGINTAHYLLKHTVPALEADQPSNTYKVTLISPSTHFFWKIGAPRTLASPDLIPFSKIFKPIEDGFKEYPADHFSLVIGSAVGLDEGSQTLTIQNAQSSSKSTINYTALVLATGTTSTSPLWTLHGSHETSVAAMRELHTSLPKASTILIAGGGPAGVETAGPYLLDHPSKISTNTLRRRNRHALPLRHDHNPLR